MRTGPPPASVFSDASPLGDAFRADALSRVASAGFTLIEMLVVMAVISILVALIVPAFTQVNASRALARAAYDITGQLEQARAYAKANSTYTWVGFFEESSNGSAAAEGIGRVILSVVASKDNTAMYSPTESTPAPLLAANLQQIGKLVKVENVHLTFLDPGEIPAREKVPDSFGSLQPVSDQYLVGKDDFKSHPSGAAASTVLNGTTFKYPLATTGTAKPYEFVKIIQFNPAGDAAKIVDTPTRLMEIDLRPAHGSSVDTAAKNCVAIQIAGIGGRVQIYQP